jgi:serine/threonine protein kinase
VLGSTASGPFQGSTPAADPTRPVLADYEVLEELGRGGMGIVYKARHLGLNRTVALKVIRKERLANPEAVRRFRREAQAAARLTHPNIVLIYDSDQAGDTHFLAMEYVEGVTLQRLVEQVGPLPIAQACDYIRQAALGLQHAVEQALVHRDIKPANLMITAPAVRPGQTGGVSWPAPAAQVKILDMGVARLYQLSQHGEESLTTLTQDGAVLGTPDYVAPEQLEDAHRADIRADLYSLGCTFYFLLTGQVPFPGGTLIQKLDKQRWQTPVSVDQVRPDVPPAVAAVVRKLLAKRAADRYQTPGELAAALDHLARTGHFAPVPRPAPLREVRRLAGHTDCIWSVAIAGDGRSALSGGKDRTIRLWDTASGQELRRFPDQAQEVKCVIFSPDGRYALVASGATLRLWEVQTGREVNRMVGHTNTVNSVTFSPDGRRVLSAGNDRSLRLWDVQTGREIRRFVKHTGDVCSVACTPDGRHALTGSRDQTLRLWDLPEGRDLPRFPAQKGMVLSVACSPDGLCGLSGNYDTTVRLWDLASGRELRRFQGHKRLVAGVAFSPDGRRVLSGSHDQTVRLWDVQSGVELCCFDGHTDSVTCVAFSPEGRYALSGSADRTLCLWQLPD